MINYNNTRSIETCGPHKPAKPILHQLQETIAERHLLIRRWEKLAENRCASPDIHTELAKTIAEFKIERKYWEQRLYRSNN